MTTLVIADCTGTDNDNDKFIVIMVIVISYCQRTKMIVMIGMLIMIMRIIRKNT